MKKGSKKSGKLGLVLISLLTVIVIAVNIACVSLYSMINSWMSVNLNPLITGSKASVSGELLSPEEAKAQSLAIAQELESEGIVLLENKGNALPLASGTRVNLFGYAGIDPIYGGTGSGSGDTSANIDPVTGLKEAGLEVNPELVDFYKKSGVSRAAQSGYTGSDFTPAEVPSPAYTEAVLSQARSYADVAVVMISRVGGEGGDLPMDMYAAGYSKTDDGRHYLELTQDEEDLLALVKSQNYSKVIVLVNSSNAMELGFLREEGVDAALWIGSPGAVGFRAVGEVLTGKVTPSGRLTDTYAYDLTTAPAYWNAGNFTYGNSKRSYVEYAEGIYVGYRFYETRWIDNATGVCDEEAYRAAVQYPFGYGLSYTTFEQSIVDFKADEKTVTVQVKVTNTGSVAGKDVVQVYYTAPYTVGGIEKAHVVLGGFAKTGMLDPGKSNVVTVSFPMEDMASYDYAGAKAYVLEAGTYQIKLMNNAHEVIDQRPVEVKDTITYTAGRSSDVTAATNQFDDLTYGQIKTYVSRADWEGTLPMAREDGKTASDDVLAAIPNVTEYVSDPADPAIVIASHGLTLEDMVGLDYDDPKWAQLLEQLSVDDMVTMISNGGWSTPEIASVGKPATSDLDGPAGINSLVSSLRGVSFPSEAVIGATFNTELVERFGKIFAQEAMANHVVGLYAPGVNIHRTPFSGRNFEYFSEDPVLSGKLASAEVKGAASQGVYMYVKHFALNDQESNRLNISVWANEQAIREIYLKPFEIAVKEGKTTAIMSSYSRLGTTWAGANKALLTNVLRNEWGFKGMVVTDSAMANTKWMDVNLSIRAGGDMMLCLMGVKLDASTNTAQQAMRRACHNILYTQANSAAVSVAADNRPFWIFLLALLDGITLGVILNFIWAKLARKGGAVRKLLVMLVCIALSGVIFWIIYFNPFQTTPVKTDVPDATAVPEITAEPAAEATEAPAAAEAPAAIEGLFLQLDQKDAGGWLGCHVYLMQDGTYSIAYDYNAENMGIVQEKGTFAIDGMGVITMTSADGETVSPATAAMNEDGTITYTATVTESNTSTVCNPTGIYGSAAPAEEAAAPAIEGLFLELSQKDAEGWLGCHVYLMQDGTYSIAYDYNAENMGIVQEKGTFAIDGMGVITMTSEDGETVSTATAAMNEDGTITYTATVTETNTSIVCNPTGIYNAGASAEQAQESAPAVDALPAPVANANGFVSAGLYQPDANGWLGCHVVLNEDGTFIVSYDFNAENSGIVQETGTYVANEDGSFTLTNTEDEPHTLTVTDNGDGTVTWAVEVTEINTDTLCKPVATYAKPVAAAPSAPAAPAANANGFVSAGLYQPDANGWLGCHVVLNEDGTFIVSYDFNAENSGIVQETGTYVANEDGSFTLTNTEDETHTLTVTDNGDGTVTWAVEVTEVNTDTLCKPVATYAKPVATAPSAPAAPVANANGFVSAGLYQPDANGWLGCHVVLNEDGTFIVSYDFNAENSGIVQETGTYTANEDGSFTLTNTDDETHALTVTDNGDGTMTWSVEVTEVNTETLCKPVATFSTVSASTAQEEAPAANNREVPIPETGIVVVFDLNTTDDLTDDEIYTQRTTTYDEYWRPVVNEDVAIYLSEDGTLSIALPAPKREGYYFAGWQTRPDVTADMLVNGVSPYQWFPGQKINAAGQAVMTLTPAEELEARMMNAEAMDLTPFADENKRVTLYARWVELKQISNAAEFQAMANDLYGAYELTADITLDETYRPIGCYFSNYEYFETDWWAYAFRGTLLGNGHTISGLTLTSAEYDTSAYTGSAVWHNDGLNCSGTVAMFGAISGATIRDLTVQAPSMQVTYSGDYLYVSTVAAFDMASNLTNVKVVDAQINVVTDEAKAANRDSLFVCVSGLEAGGWSSNVTDCSVSGTIALDAQTIKSHGGEIYLGGLIGENYAMVSGCAADAVTLRLNANDASSAEADTLLTVNVGGLGGSNTSTKSSTVNAVIDTTVNKPVGESSVNIGGVTGSQRYLITENSTVNAAITDHSTLDSEKGKLNIGAIAGRIDVYYMLQILQYTPIANTGAANNTVTTTLNDQPLEELIHDVPMLDGQPLGWINNGPYMIAEGYEAPSNIEALIDACGSYVPQSAMMEGIIWVQVQ